MRTSAGIAVVLLALSAIVGSVHVQRDRRAGASAGASSPRRPDSRFIRPSEALSRLDSVHQDMRMLADLVERSRQERQLDTATERRVWESAFRALAVVVVHYRVIALVSRDGALDVLAIDPTENRATAEAVLADVVKLGKTAAAKEAENGLGEPARFGARSFLIYAMPVAGGGAIVVASDAALLLRSVAWPQLPATRLFVTDPSGVVWSGCETSAGCRVADRQGRSQLRAGGRRFTASPRRRAGRSVWDSSLPRRSACPRRSAGRPATGSSPGSPRPRPSRSAGSRSSRGS